MPTVTYAQGTQSFGLGGNGISPGSGVDFFAFDRNTGAQVGFVPGRPAQYYTTTARSNCVVNENGPFFFTLPPGNYRIVANYFPGNNFRLVTHVVANVDVLPPAVLPRRIHGTRAAASPRTSAGSATELTTRTGSTPVSPRRNEASGAPPHAGGRQWQQGRRRRRSSAGISFSLAQDGRKPGRSRWAIA